MELGRYLVIKVEAGKEQLGMYVNGWNKNTLQIAHGTEGIGKNNSPRAEEENFRESLLRKIGMEGVQGVREVPV
ncbi:MAG: hypothetical protein IKM28_02985, partial [Lachnospiraceae bacterium]|nr:hypothetical protein [Lachnospiraceae bacterium]